MSSSNKETDVHTDVESNNEDPLATPSRRRISVDESNVVARSACISPGPKGSPRDSSGCYNLVAEEGTANGGDDLGEGDDGDDNEASNGFWNACSRIVHRNWIPDDATTFRVFGNALDGNLIEVKLLENPTVVKLMKFGVLTFSGIFLMHHVVRWMVRSSVRFLLRFILSMWSSSF